MSKEHRITTANRQASLKILREKAQQRNPDEYYHEMHSRKVDGKGLLLKSRRAADEESSLSTDQVKLLKTQDANYVRTLLQNERQVLNRQSQNTMFKAKGSHTVFVDDQATLHNFDAHEYFHTTAEMLHRCENRLTKEQLADQSLSAGAGKIGLDSETLERKRLKKLRQLQQHQDRERQLAGVLQRMDLERERMKKGSKKKIQDAQGNVAFKWKKQRKR